MIAGFADMVNNELGVQVPYVLGSFGYLIGSILSMMMWKLNQFGLVYLPDLNAEIMMHFKGSPKDRTGDNSRSVLYLDIFFLCLFTLSSATGIYAVTFAAMCPRYGDWSKNFLLSTVGHLSVVALGSVMHRVPTVPPYSYLLWVLRLYLCWDFVNLSLDMKRVVGGHCVD